MRDDSANTEPTDLDHGLLKALAMGVAVWQSKHVPKFEIRNSEIRNSGDTYLIRLDPPRKPT
jgi:hypothetical protein